MKLQWQEAHPNNYRQGRGDTKVDRVVIHIAEGHLHGTASWFQNPKAKVSAHFTVGADGTVIQSVSEKNTAFHAGPVPPGQPDMNARSIGIEHEGFQNPAKPWVPTDAQLDATAQLVAGICQRHGIPVGRTHLIGHNEVFPGRAARAHCPGAGWPWDRFIALVMQHMLVRPAPSQPQPPAAVPAPQPDAGKRTVRLMDASTNLPIGTGSLVNDKVYLTPETLKQLREG
ncbi:N-acetylmuramoyl-L-alanine amidase [Deinococcus enclensis]|uniref:N-acetylmuramoyl-L-alanine amidase n=1 Tax=Deinococcus enclensis TaxID=1049582 RepID=A0ABT9ME34_9DEIO|nr:peptidoglycan recognition family protein [Deinococcus enclensis]MDP9764857.1 N-acetyl-anhydromuramyl-L-alanine amidase AmpD [Deinococcus enclensis]